MRDTHTHIETYGSEPPPWLFLSAISRSRVLMVGTAKGSNASGLRASMGTHTRPAVRCVCVGVCVGICMCMLLFFSGGGGGGGGSMCILCVFEFVCVSVGVLVWVTIGGCVRVRGCIAYACTCVRGYPVKKESERVRIGLRRLGPETERDVWSSIGLRDHVHGLYLRDHLHGL